MATSNIVNTLGAGSGIDVKALTENLVEAERGPKKGRIDQKITKTEAKISGYGAMKFALTDLKAAFAKLNDASDFSSIKPNNTQPSAFGVQASLAAEAGSYSVEVLQTALAQRTASQSFAARDTSLNGGTPFDLDLSIGGVSKGAISVTTPTPAGMVSAINGAKLGVTAQLINTGSGFQVVVSGATGQAQNFSLGTASTGGVTPLFNQSLQDARDAQVKVNGLTVTRGSNTINDVIDGITLDLYTTTTQGVPARLDLNRDSGAIKDSIRGLVTAYNDFDESLKILGDSSSKVEEFGGVLAGETLLQSVRAQVRGFITNTSSTPGAAIKAGRDVGLSIDRYGKLTLDESKLDTALQNNFAEVSTMFSAGTNNKSMFSTAPAGMAGDAVYNIEKMLRSTGMIETQSKNAVAQIAKYKGELSILEDRMSKLKARYLDQFSAMDSIVGTSNSTRAGLKGTFEGMMAAYTSK